MYHFGFLVKSFPYNVGKVLAFEAHLEHIISLESQLPLYIVHHLWCSRSRKCQYRNIRLKPSYVGNMQIRGTEVVAPLRYAMCLVHRYKAHFYALKLLSEHICANTLWRYIQQLGVAQYAVVEHRHNLMTRHTRVYGSRYYPSPSKVLHLVLHQGDKRSYDNAHALLRKSRHLECKRLASTSRHQSQGVFALGNAVYYVALDTTECGITPHPVQYIQILLLVHISQSSSSAGLISSICSCTILRLNTLSSMV